MSSIADVSLLVMKPMRFAHSTLVRILSWLRRIVSLYDSGPGETLVGWHAILIGFWIANPLLDSYPIRIMFSSEVSLRLVEAGLGGALIVMGVGQLLALYFRHPFWRRSISFALSLSWLALEFMFIVADPGVLAVVIFPVYSVAAGMNYLKLATTTAT
jgi:hypothetical protein